MGIIQDGRAANGNAPQPLHFVESLKFFGIALLLVALAFPKVFIGIDTFFYRDFGTLGYPYGVFLRDSLISGELPLWNPLSHCGVPFLAQWGTCYPPSVLVQFLPMPWAGNFMILFHLAFGGAGMFWLARRFGLGTLAAGFAGVAYIFNGVSVSCLLWGNYISSLCWMPWLVGCVIQSWRTGGRWTALAALIAALQVLTATPELTLFTWMVIAALWIGELTGRKVLWKVSVARTLLIVALASLITMIQMLPFFDLLQHSQRTADYGDQKWAMPVWGLANLFVPLFHNYRAPDGIWFQSHQDFLGSYYLGIAVLVLACAGVWLKRTRAAIILGIMAVLFWIMALGNDGVLYALVRKAFPMIGFARFPVKFAIPTAFILPLLAAHAIEAMAESPKRAARVLSVFGTAAIIVVMGVLWVAWERPFKGDEWNATAWNALSRVLLMLVLLGGLLISFKMPSSPKRLAVQLALLVLIPLDAMSHNPGMMPTLPRDFLAPGMWEASGRPAAPRVGEGRIMLTPQAEDRLLYSVVTNHPADFAGKRLAEWSNLNLIDRIPKVNGAMTLRPAHFDVLERYIYFTRGTLFGHGLADFLSVSWMSSPVNPTQWIPRTNYLPVISGGQQPVFVNDDDALKGITEVAFNPREVVYLPESASAAVQATNRTRVSIAQTTFGLNEVNAEIEALAPTIVVLSQSYYHKWRAYVDSEPVPLLRANLAFQAVPIPAGKHQLKLAYEDRSFTIGGILTLCGLAIALVLWRRSLPLASELHHKQPSP